jgi:hypothetical protein
MNLEPILGVWGGMYLSGEVIAQEDLLPYINEVLNELEFLMVTKQLMQLHRKFRVPDTS